MTEWLHATRLVLLKWLKLIHPVISLILFKEPIQYPGCLLSMMFGAAGHTSEERTEGNLMSSMKLINFECSA